MEKYLRLLNPKTTNFDAIGGGSHGSMTAQDVCVALSYANLTSIQQSLLNICAMSQNSIEQIKVTTKHIQAELNAMKRADLSEDTEISIFIALVELSKVPGSYKHSVRNRAVIAGVSKDRVQRKLNQVVNEYKGLFEDEIKKISSKIKYQFKD